MRFPFIEFRNRGDPLFVIAPNAAGKTGNIGYASFTIKTIAGGARDEPHDVGEIKVK